jgi:hypothetical protein
MTNNIRFDYLYRDAGNYKSSGSVNFANPDGLRPELIAEDLRRAFLEGCLFVAHQVRIPTCFLFEIGKAGADDHCFHEFEAVDITENRPDDPESRSIRQFIVEIQAAARQGWAAFDVNTLSR